MPTVREICQRALQRIRIVAAGEDITAEDAELARTVLNDMIYSWPALGVQVHYTELGLTDEFRFFAPPPTVSGEAIADLTYYGGWNASTNDPYLGSGTGLRGEFYKVTTAGNTVLDDYAVWSIGDYAIFDGAEWVRSMSTTRLNRAVIDMLALELCQEFGKEPSQLIARNGRTGWIMVQAAFIKAPIAVVDRAVMQTMQRSIMESDMSGDEQLPSAVLLDDDGVTPLYED